jgi:hypothetical protein
MPGVSKKREREMQELFERRYEELWEKRKAARLAAERRKQQAINKEEPDATTR